MLRYMRKKARWVLFVTLALIIPPFVFMYGWSAIRQSQPGARGETVYATYTIDSEEGTVGPQEVMLAEQELVSRLQQIYGPRVIQALESQYGRENLFTLRDRIDEAINLAILDHEARKRGLVVPREMVLDEMARILGRFERELWPRVLDQMGVRSDQELYERLRRVKLLDLAAQSRMVDGHVSDYEVWLEYTLTNEELEIDYVAFPFSRFLDEVEVTSESMQSYYDENREMFRVPPQRRYRYAYLKREQIGESIEPTDDQLLEYFQNNADDYTIGATAWARAILIPVDVDNITSAGAFRATYERLTQQADAITTRLLGGADFAALADEYNPDAVSELVGEGGRIDEKIAATPEVQERWGNMFVDTVLNLEAGDFSTEPLFTSGEAFTGIALVKVDEKTEARPAEFDEVRDEVEADFRAERADVLFTERSSAIADQMGQYTLISQMAEALGMEDGVTSWVRTTATTLIDEIGEMSADNRDYIAELGPGDRSVLLREEGIAYVIEVAEHRDSYIPSLDEARDRVREALMADLTRDVAAERSAEFLKTARAAESFEGAAAAAGRDVFQAGPFTRLDAPTDLPGGPMLNFERQSLLAARGDIQRSPTGLSTEKPTGYIVWRLSAVETPDRETFKTDAPQLKASLLMAKQRAALREWLADRRLEVNVEIHPDFEDRI